MTVIKRTIWFLIACFALNLLGNEFDDVVKEAAGVVDNLFHDEKVNELFKGDNEEKISNINKALKGEFMNLNTKYERFVDICKYEKEKNIENIKEDL